MSENECINCKKIFSSKGNLTKHLKKSCKFFRENNMINNTNTELTNIKKELDKILLENNQLKKEKDKINLHKKKYNKKLKNENNELKHIIDELSKENQELKIKLSNLTGKIDIYKEIDEKQFNTIADIAKQPTTNTYKQKIFLTPFDIKDSENIENIKNKLRNNIDKTHILEGQKGVAKLVYNNVLKDENGENKKYICTDFSRGVFKYKDKDGVYHKDNKAKNLTSIVYGGIKESLDNIDNRDFDENTYNLNSVVKNVIDIKNMNNDNCDFRNELITLSTNSIEL